MVAMSDELLLKSLQDYRRDQYEILMGTIYAAKGYDRNSIPTDEKLQRLGFEGEDYFQIVEGVRHRVAG
jgi:hypothetical protein